MHPAPNPPASTRPDRTSGPVPHLVVHTVPHHTDGGPRPRRRLVGRTLGTLGVLCALVLVAAACGDDDSSADTSADAPTTTEAAAGPTTGPASIVAEDQMSDGTSIVVASVDLPTEGYIVVHADADGSPGPLLGWSDLLPAGTSTDVTVTLNAPLDGDATVWPMAHVDADGDHVYEFMPPDETTDVPATTADGKIAVVPIEVTVG